MQMDITEENNLELSLVVFSLLSSHLYLGQVELAKTKGTLLVKVVRTFGMFFLTGGCPDFWDYFPVVGEFVCENHLYCFYFP